MNSKSTRFSVYDRIVHEYYVSLRSQLRSGRGPEELRSGIMAAVSLAKKHLVQSSVIFVIVSIVVNTLSNGTDITVRTTIVNVEIPEVYAIFAAASTWVAILLSTLQISGFVAASVLFDRMRDVSERFSSARIALDGGEHFDAISPIRPGHLHTYSRKVNYLLNFWLLAVILFLLIPLVGAYVSVFKGAVAAMLESNDVFLGFPLAIASLSLLILPCIYFLVYYVPFAVEKDLDRIRWSFLAKVTEVNSVKFSRWLGKSS